MIPVRLTLTNFMSYGEAAHTVDFSAFRLACLSGDNGHGKSALLDAITWVLWGEARAHVDSLVRNGQTEMRVELEFLVDGVRYLVNRKRALKGTGATRTDLFIINEAGDSRSQTGQGERGTQEKIIQLLRMDYRSFINSAFILQGRADEFTRQTSTERKRILAEILDLRRFDLLEALAREKQRAADERGRLAQHEIENLDRSLSQRPGYERSLQVAAEVVKTLEGDRSVCQQQLDTCLKELSALAASVRLLDTLKAQAQKAESESLRARKRSEELSARLADLDRKLQNAKDVQHRLQALDSVCVALDALESAHQRSLAIEADQRRIETELREARHDIEIQQSKLQTELKDLQRRSVEAPRLKEELSQLRAGHRASSELEKEMDALREQRDAQAQRVNVSASDLSALLRERERLAQRRVLLEAPSASCPLCAQPLQEHDHARLIRELDGEEEIIGHQQQDLEKERAAAEAEIQRLTAAARSLRSDLEAARKAETRSAALEQELANAESAACAAPEKEKALAALTTRLAGPIDPGLAARLAACQTALAEIGYQPAEHNRLRAEARRLEPARAQAQELHTAAEMRQEVLKQQVEAAELLQRASHDLDTLKAQIGDLAEVAEQRKALEAQRIRLETAREDLIRRAASAAEEVSRWQTLVDQCREFEEQRKLRFEELTAANKDAAIYKDLVTAFGKKGIQAMIIENAIPEIESEANRLLSLMTDNGMQVQFHTQRELKKGGGAETLDILIGDQSGDRPYECYSGGEAFRINFAIRIALSRLLARRAGAQLQTIVIDEGFGSQDTQGRRRLLEAIHSVKDEFERILVITHLDDLKDEFPVRLHVTKDDRGSRVTMIS